MSHDAAAQKQDDAAALPTRYTVRSLVMPLPPQLNARVHKQLRAAAAAGATVSSVAGSAVQPAAACSSPPQHLALRCDWSFTVHPTHPAPLVSLPLLVDCLQFVLGAFPFPSAQAAIDGLTRVVALLPKLSERSQAARIERMPQIESVHVRADLIGLPLDAPCGSDSAALPALLSLTSHRRSADCRMLGQDTLNSWGDVDVILEVPSPTPDNGSTVAPETVASPGAGDAAASASSLSAPLSSSAEDDADFSAGLYCLNLLPGASIPLHIHRRMTESELMLPALSGGALESQGVPVRRGSIHRWPLDFPHFYRNRSRDTVQRILCIDVPRFTRDLEILVQQPPSAMPLAMPPRGMRGEEILIERWTPRVLAQAATSFEFPGGLASQTVRLTTDPGRWVQAHAVLVFVFGPPKPAAAASTDAAAAAPPSLLFVHHRRRGWELPGGKIDAGESAEVAAAREVAEEAAQALEPGSIRMIAQYTIEEGQASPHVKSVFVARAAVRSGDDDAEALKLETDDAAFIAPPDWEAMFAETDVSDRGSAASPDSSSASSISAHRRYSSILDDNVYPICLKMAMAAAATTTTQTKATSS